MISDNRQLLLITLANAIFVVSRWHIIESVPNLKPQPYQTTKQSHQYAF